MGAGGESDYLMQFGELEIQGYSLGGIETAVWLPRLRLAIDVGRGPQMLVKADKIALTHCHMDHAGGLAYLLALRQLYGMKGPTIYVPAQSADKLKAVLDAWDRLQRFDSNYEIVPVEAGHSYSISRDVELRPFRTYHVVPSVGYEVIRVSNKLKAQYIGIEGKELGRLKKSGVAITERSERTLLAVTGDTLVEVLDKQPHVLTAENLICECTFLDGRKPYENARAGGHIHLTDLLSRVEAFDNQRLILSHFSQIYSRQETAVLLEPLAKQISPKLFAFPTAEGEPWLEPGSEAPDLPT